MAKCVECGKDTDTLSLSYDLDICDKCDNLKAFGCKQCDKDINASEYYRNDGYCDNCR